ncbi:MAG: fused MFS/spermidine synthase [Acidobacteria bacterium]|nr:fused MFS/spermidine synthase [Acidobacteriota bacterium]
MSARLILVAYAASGSAGLIYEVIWQRGLALVIGSATTATAVVLAAFLGGLALGAFVFGPPATRTTRPLVVYAALELAIAGLGAVLTFVWLHATWWSGLVWQLAGDGVGVLGARLVVASVLLLPPAVLMGGTFPVLARQRLRLPRADRWVPLLYAVNTVGAVAGALAAGFVLLPSFGASRATLVAAALNAAAAAGALALARRERAVVARSGDLAQGAKELPLPEARTPVALWVVLALSGAITLAFEVVWTRALTLVLGSSTYAFATMLATYIGGLALGGVAGARLAPRLPRPIVSLAWVQLGTAAGALAALQLVPQLPVAFLYMFRLTGDHPLGLGLGMSLLAGAIMFPTAVTQGVVFPVGVHVIAGSRRHAEASAGAAYAVSTIGAVAGALLATFWLIPVFGIDGAGGAVTAASLLAAVLLVFKGGQHGAPSPRFVAEGAMAAAGLALLVFFPRWDPLRLGTGVYRDAPRLLELYPSPRDFPRIFEHYRPLFYRDGTGASVLVYERPSLADRPHQVLAIDGKVEASTADDMATQVLSGHLPVMAGARADRALIIGVASGITLGALAQHPFREIVAVEIEPAVLDAARAFRDFNHDVLADPRVRLVVDDGRSYLAGEGEPFDVIVSEPSNPWIPGSARLFTREFFELVRRRLAPDGVFAQWIQMYGLEPALLQTVVRTFQSVFPEVLAVRPGQGDLILLGSARPVRVDYAHTAAMLADRHVASDLDRIGITGPADIVARLLIGGADVPAYAGDGTLNTDDNALVEFAAARSLYRNTIADNEQALAAHASHTPMRYVDRLGETSEARAEAGRAIAVAYSRAGQWAPAARVAQWSLEQAPSANGWWLAGEAAAKAGRPADAESAWTRALSFDPQHAAARLALARLAWRSGDHGEAKRLLHPLLEGDRPDPNALYLSGLIAARENAHALAAHQLNAALAGWTGAGDRWAVRYALAATRHAMGDEAEAAAEEARVVQDLKAWCASLADAAPAPDETLTETEPVVDLMAFDRAGATRVLAQHLLEPLTQFYRGKTLYLLGYWRDATSALGRAVQLGGCETASQYLALAQRAAARAHE